MKLRVHDFFFLQFCLIGLLFSFNVNAQTQVEIKEDQFFINGEITYKGRYWENHKIEGLLFNSRMVQGIFDDLNPETRTNFKYPDTKKWDPDRNTNEFIEAMPKWKEHGVLAFTLNLQGGSPLGYGNHGWINSTFDEKGELRLAYMQRLEKILTRSDELGMVVILGYFYFGQDEHLENEKSVLNAVDNITQWLLDKGYGNVLIEINNECNVRYDHEILQPHRVHELIKRVQKKSKGKFYVSTSYGGGFLPLSNVVQTADFILLHGNGVHNPDSITTLVENTRKVKGYSPKPILFNEDDHFNFDSLSYNMLSATKMYASWGYFDYRKWNEPFEVGYQTVPVDWGINSSRKISFFHKVKEITGITSHTASWESLFDGKTLDGWVVKKTLADKDKNFWSVENNMIIANSIADSTHDYVWLMTEKEFTDFELKFKFQVYKSSTGNSGIQFRSSYDDESFWLNGPQIDIHPSNPWRIGMMWDETRGNQRWIYPDLDTTMWINPGMALHELTLNYADTADVWNEMRITARGMEVKAWVNNVNVTDFNGEGILNDKTHNNLNVGTRGHIALQIHKYDQLRINFKDIIIRELY